MSYFGMRDRFYGAGSLGATLIIAAVLASWAYLLLIPQPRLPANFANGVYYNPCCGNIILLNGKASSKFGQFHYMIEKDKIGPYVLPIDKAVFADSIGISVAPAKSGLFIRVDTSPPLQWIDIKGPQVSYHFTRLQPERE